jgi:hypothetical protein
MARSLDRRGLEVYGCRLAFKKETQEMIAFIRSSSPSRNPWGSKGNMCVWYPSEKMECIIKAESRKVEFPWVLEAEYDDDVLGYFD